MIIQPFERPLTHDDRKEMIGRLREILPIIYRLEAEMPAEQAEMAFATRRRINLLLGLMEKK